jgi:amidase
MTGKFRHPAILLALSLTLLTPSCGPAFQVSQQPFQVTETTIVHTQDAIRSGRITCRAIVLSYLARIQAYDHPANQPRPLNSLILLNPAALTEAEDCDHRFHRTGQLLPLSGIVLIIKDNYDTAGLQTTGGSLAMKGFVPATDATMIRKLRAAGAILLAKSNMAEWAFSPYVTESSIAGITRNAYDLTRVPAGSSGGTAASVAANLGESGLGTDTGNSIRGPSAHNDLVGIRPTIGLTSRSGIIPLFAHNDVGGPIARSVADAAAILTVIAGPDPTDPVTTLNPHQPVDYTRFLDSHGLRGARIGVFRSYFSTSTTDPEVRAVTEHALHDLQAQGAVLIDPFTLPNYSALTKNLWCGDFQADLNAYLAKHPNAPYPNLQSIVASGLYLPYIEDEIRATIKPPAKGHPPAPCLDVYHDPSKIAFRNALLAAMDRDHLDAIVYPTWSNPPRKVGDMTSPAGDNSQVLSPQTGFPAITLPMGFTHGNLPAGLTILGRAYSEGELIRLAYSYEQATHHRRPPSGFPPLPAQETPLP